MASFASLKKAETLFWLICCERKILFRLKRQAEKYGLENKRAYVSCAVFWWNLTKTNGACSQQWLILGCTQQWRPSYMQNRTFPLGCTQQC